MHSCVRPYKAIQSRPHKISDFPLQNSSKILPHSFLWKNLNNAWKNSALLSLPLFTSCNRPIDFIMLLFSMLLTRVMWDSELEPLSSYLIAVTGWTGLKGVEQDLSGLNGLEGYRNEMKSIHSYRNGVALQLLSSVIPWQTWDVFHVMKDTIFYLKAFMVRKTK